MIKEFKFYKEDNRWYVYLPEYPGDKSDLEMVCNADKMLDLYAKENKEVILQVDENHFLNADLLEYIRPNYTFGGAYYFMESCQGDIVVIAMWLCGVMNFIYGNELPKQIYVKIK